MRDPIPFAPLGIVLERVSVHTYEGHVQTSIAGRAVMTVRMERHAEVDEVRHEVAIGALRVRGEYHHDDADAWSSLLDEARSWSERLYRELLHLEDVGRMSAPAQEAVGF